MFELTKDVLPVYYSYIVLGFIALFANLIIITVYFSTYKLRTKFAMYIGLAAADMINGLGFTITGGYFLLDEMINQYLFQGLKDSSNNFPLLILILFPYIIVTNVLFKLGTYFKL